MSRKSALLFTLSLTILALLFTPASQAHGTELDPPVEPTPGAGRITVAPPVTAGGLTYREPVMRSPDGSTLYNAVPPVALIADPDLELPGLRYEQAPEIAAAIADPGRATATFDITFKANGTFDPWGTECSTFPEQAKTAFQAAASIWGARIQSSVPIEISACWGTGLPSGVLGYSGGQPLQRDFTNAPQANTWYQGSLANALAGSDLDPADYDMHITYSKDFSWYLGTDGNPPGGQYDLVTVAAHEIAHGLNFSGSAQYSMGLGSYGYATPYPGVFDTFMESGAGQALTSYANPSVALGNLYTSNDLWWDGTYANAANSGGRVKMYAPSSWSGGSSVSHLDYSTFSGSPNRMMVYAYVSAIHDPGVVTLGILQDMGWRLVSNEIPDPITPSGTIDDPTPTYKWSKIDGAASYELRLFRNSNLVYSEEVDPTASCNINCVYTPAASLSDNSYQWRVRAKIGAEWKDWSAWENFTLTTVPALISPSGTINDPRPTFTWSKIASASSYEGELWEGNVKLFTVTVAGASCTTNCTYTHTSDMNEGNFKWRVRAEVESAWRDWSDYEFFSVATTLNAFLPLIIN